MKQIRNDRHLPFLIALPAGVALSLFGGMMSVGTPQELMIGAVILFGMAWSAWVVRHDLPRMGVLGVAPLLAFSYLIHYAFGSSLYILWEWGDFSAPQYFGLLTTRQVDFQRGGLILLLGGFGWITGTLFPNRSAETGMRKAWSTRTDLKASLYPMVGLLLCGHVVTLLLVPRLGAGMRQIAMSAGMVTHALTLLAAFEWGRAEDARTRYQWMGVYIIGALGIAALTLLEGMREHVLRAATFGVLGYWAGHRKLPRWHWLVTFAIALMLVLPILNVFKQLSLREPKEESSTTRLEVARESASENFADQMVFGVVHMAARLNLAQYPYRYAYFYPDFYRPLYGASFGLELANMVPRFLWPDKPQVSTELNEYAREVGIVNQEDMGSSAVFDGFSEYYANFGYLGVFLFATMGGMYYRMLAGICSRWAPGPIGLVIFACQMIDNHDLFGFIYLFDTHVKTIIIWTILLRITVVCRDLWQPPTVETRVYRGSWMVGVR